MNFVKVYACGNKKILPINPTCPLVCISGAFIVIFDKFTNFDTQDKSCPGDVRMQCQQNPVRIKMFGIYTFEKGWKTCMVPEPISL